jgi:hypothetical protein
MLLCLIDVRSNEFYIWKLKLKRAKTDSSLESGPMREGRGLAGTSVWGPESQERACESLKGPISLAIDGLR